MAEARLRDKTYIAAKNMLFNVTGYQHPPHHLYGSLKYIDGRKWKDGYTAAIEFLQQKHPEFVAGSFIQIPSEQITTVYDPRARWTELLRAKEEGRGVSSLHQEALDLADGFRKHVNIPLDEFGITDSLLWSDGHCESDIDLVVFGEHQTERILHAAEAIYKQDDFARPDPAVMKAPYSLKVDDWPAILARKMHMGAFRGRLFSLRVILTDEALKQLGREKYIASNTAPNETSTLVEFEIADAKHSLCFPATYRNQDGDELVDYSVVYEGVFRAGEKVRAKCTGENVEFENGKTIQRFTIAKEHPVTIVS